MFGKNSHSAQKYCGKTVLFPDGKRLQAVKIRPYKENGKYYRVDALFFTPPFRWVNSKKPIDINLKLDPPVGLN